MDLSQEFFELVRRFGEQSGWSQEQLLSVTKEQIMKAKKQPSQFLLAAQGVVQNLDEMWKFITQNRDAYIHMGQVSENQRDQMEQEVSEFAKTCSQRIQQMNDSVQSGQAKINKQTKAHLLGVVLILSEQLQQATQLFDICRSLRYQAAIDKERRKRARSGTSSKQMLNNLQERQQHNMPMMNGVDELKINSSSATSDYLEQESIALTNEILERSQKVNFVESSVQEIAVFNQLLTSQLLGQAHQIEQLYSEAIEASHHIEAGNVQLKKTIEVNKGSNVYWILLFVMLIFVLLFMDLYIG